MWSKDQSVTFLWQSESQSRSGFLDPDGYTGFLKDFYCIGLSRYRYIAITNLSIIAVLTNISVNS